MSVLEVCEEMRKVVVEDCYEGRGRRKNTGVLYGSNRCSYDDRRGIILFLLVLSILSRKPFSKGLYVLNVFPSVFLDRLDKFSLMFCNFICARVGSECEPSYRMALK